MSRLIREATWQLNERRQLRDELVARIDTLSAPELEVISDFVKQIVACHDPDVVGDFLQWRQDPTLGSILQLAAALSDDLREELLFVAEDFYSSEKVEAK